MDNFEANPMYDIFFANQIKRRRRPRNPSCSLTPPAALYSSRVVAAKLTMPSFDLLSRSKRKCALYSKECKRRLLSAFKGRPSKPDVASKDCPILNLHTDALNCIMDFLPPASQMALLHTCKALYRALGGRVAVTRESATLTDYRQYLLFLCRSRLTSYTCLDCNDIHEFKVTAKPHNSRIITCPKQQAGHVQGSSLRGPHQLGLGEVQSACKLHRMDGKALLKTYRQFLANVSSTSKHEGHVRTYSGNRRYPINRRTTTRVVGGKLYLKRVWVTHYGYARRRFLHDVFGNIQVCPHFNTSRVANRSCPLGEYQQLDLVYSVQAALRTPYQTQYLSCLNCPTDINAYVHSMKRSAVLVAWQCLGGEDVESPSFWERHSWKDRIPYSQGQDERDWHRGTSHLAFEQGVLDWSQSKCMTRRGSIIRRCRCASRR